MPQRLYSPLGGKEQASHVQRFGGPMAIWTPRLSGMRGRCTGPAAATRQYGGGEMKRKRV